MRKPVKEIENVLQNHGYSINNIICEIMKTFKLKTLFRQVGPWRALLLVMAKQFQRLVNPTNEVDDKSSGYPSKFICFFYH